MEREMPVAGILGPPENVDKCGSKGGHSCSTTMLGPPTGPPLGARSGHYFVVSDKLKTFKGETAHLLG